MFEPSKFDCMLLVHVLIRSPTNEYPQNVFREKSERFNQDIPLLWCYNVTYRIFTIYYREIGNILTQLFKTNDVISKRTVKTLIIKYGIYANIFAEKCE